MTNWIKGMALAPRDRRIIKAFGIATWPDGTQHPEMRFIWRDWREMPAATIEEPNKVIRLDESWEPQTPHPFRPTHWAEADKPPLDLEPNASAGIAKVVARHRSVPCPRCVAKGEPFDVGCYECRIHNIPPLMIADGSIHPGKP